MTAIDLPNAKNWKFTGHLVANRIFRKGRLINLDTITDAQVEKLMKEEPSYWQAHFQKKEEPKQAAKADKKDATKS